MPMIHSSLTLLFKVFSGGLFRITSDTCNYEVTAFRFMTNSLFNFFAPYFFQFYSILLGYNWQYLYIFEMYNVMV